MTHLSRDLILIAFVLGSVSVLLAAVTRLEAWMDELGG